jgi:hypothetical protein
MERTAKAQEGIDDGHILGKIVCLCALGVTGGQGKGLNELSGAES